MITECSIQFNSRFYLRVDTSYTYNTSSNEGGINRTDCRGIVDHALMPNSLHRLCKSLYQFNQVN